MNYSLGGGWLKFDNRHELFSNCEIKLRTRIRRTNVERTTQSPECIEFVEYVSAGVLIAGEELHLGIGQLAPLQARNVLVARVAIAEAEEPTLGKIASSRARRLAPTDR